MASGERGCGLRIGQLRVKELRFAGYGWGSYGLKSYGCGLGAGLVLGSCGLSGRPETEHLRQCTITRRMIRDPILNLKVRRRCKRGA
jgi:hypothetical protein